LTSQERIAVALERQAAATERQAAATERFAEVVELQMPLGGYVKRQGDAIDEEWRDLADIA
jgi:hypothetical protein